MKALCYRKKNELSNFEIFLEDIPKPSIRDTDVLVSVKAVGTNPGEAQMRRTIDPPKGGIIILGYEFAGIVKEIGADVTGINIGDYVYGIGNPMRTGAYAELIAADHRTVAHFPRSLSFAQAVSFPVGALTSWQAMFRQDNELPKDVNTVLVLGAAGGVGSIAGQLLKALTSVKVIATASREESSTWLKKMGADIVVDHYGDVKGELAAHGILEVDLVFSVNGLSAAISWVSEIIRPYGYLSVIEGKGVIDYNSIMSKSINISLQTLFTNVIYGYDLFAQRSILAKLSELIEEGKIQPTVTKSLNHLTVDTLKQAHTLVELGNVIGKIVILNNK